MNLTILHLCLFLLICSFANAFDKNINNDSPIEITSDLVRYFTEDNKAFFEGKVIAVQDDIKLKCDKMEVIFEKKVQAKADQPELQNKSTGKLKTIFFLGNVEIMTPNETAKSEEGEYNVIEQKFILRKNVSLIQNGNILHGDQLIYLKKTGESLLSSSALNSKRVQGIFISNK